MTHECEQWASGATKENLYVFPVFISQFAGTLLGLHFRFFILVPALMLTWVVVISIGVASEPASGHFFFSELAFVQVVPMPRYCGL